MPEEKNNASVTFNGIADEQAKAEKRKGTKGPFETLFDMLDEEDVKQLDDMNRFGERFTPEA